MSYTDVFGGQNIFPAQLTLLKLNPLTANLTLAWAVEQALPGDEVFASIIEVTPNAGLSLSMPDARMAAGGQSTLINNIGANTITIKDNAGNVIGSVASGQVWQFYLEDNTTQAGVWKTFQFGTGASSAVAAALAGAGLKAITTTLNVKVLPVVTNATPTNIVDADRAKAYIWNGGVGAFNLPDPAAIGTDWFVYIRNAGSGNLTVTPAAGLIDGGASKTFRATESALVVSDGTNYYTIGYATSVVGFFDHDSINVGGAAGDYVLSGAELNRITYNFTGVLTGNRNVVVPASTQQYWVFNNTTGAFTLTVKTNAGTGVLIPQGFAAIVYCDSINVVAAMGDPLTSILPLSLGGTGAALVAPGSDQILFFDFSAGKVSLLTVGTGLTITGTTISSSAASALSATKTVQTSRNTVTAVALDPELVVTIPGAGTYKWEVFILAESLSSTPGLRVQMGGTATIVGNNEYAGWYSTGASNVVMPRTATNVNQDLPLTVVGGVTVQQVYKMEGSIRFSVGGTFGLSWAQAVSNANNVSLDPESYILLTKVA
jgi:hypothetical protein